MEITLRGARREDAAAVAELLAAAEEVDRVDEHYDTDDVLEEMADPAVDLALDWVLVEEAGPAGERPRLLAVEHVVPRAPADGRLSVYVDGTVHPAARGRGLGSRLLPLMVERARDHVARRAVEVGEPLLPVLVSVAPATNPGALDLLERTGFAAHRWSFVMAADLGGDLVQRRPLPEGYALETWEGQDPGELLAAHNVAFVGLPGWTPWSAQMWEHHVVGARSHRPALSVVVRDVEGQVAAYVETAEHVAHEQATGRREAWVAKVGTLPAHRHRGLAGTMLREVLHRAREAGLHVAGLDVDSENPSGALGVYERAGFGVTQTWTSFRLEPQPGGGAPA